MVAIDNKIRIVIQGVIHYGPAEFIITIQAPIEHLTENANVNLSFHVQTLKHQKKRT